MAGLCTSTSRMFQLACSYRRLAATSHIRQLPALLAWRPRQLPAATRTRAVAGSDVGDSFSSHDFSSIAAGPGSDFITSVQNNYIKHCVKLRTSSAYRAEARRFMLVGSQIMREAAANGGQLEARVLFVPERRGGAAAADTVPWGVSAQHVVQVGWPVWLDFLSRV